MYQITVNKILYTKTTKGIKTNSVKIMSENTTESNLINRMLELKRIYKDFDYNMEFVKI